MMSRWRLTDRSACSARWMANSTRRSIPKRLNLQPSAHRLATAGMAADMPSISTAARPSSFPSARPPRPIRASFEKHYGRLTVRDPKTLKIAETYSTHGIDPHDIRLTADGKVYRCGKLRLDRFGQDRKVHHPAQRGAGVDNGGRSVERQAGRQARHRQGQDRIAPSRGRAASTASSPSRRATAATTTMPASGPATASPMKAISPPIPATTTCRRRR